MSLLTAMDITKAFGKTPNISTVLTNANLTIEAGKFTTLMGPSGSGKSTLLNICGLIESADSGQLIFEGKDLCAMSVQEKTEFRRAYIGFVFQSFNLIPVMDVAANVGLPLMLLPGNHEKKKQQVMDILDQVGLADFANSKPEQLSGGQCQRVAIARALVKRPMFIIADEPTASLDAHTAIAVVGLMKQLTKEQGTACLIATHDDRLLPFSDQVLNVQQGHILRQPCIGKVSELKELDTAGALI